MVRELAILSHVLEIAIVDWGLRLTCNVVKLVRRPVVQNVSDRLSNEALNLTRPCATFTFDLAYTQVMSRLRA
jgi:hypothetical protein